MKMSAIRGGGSKKDLNDLFKLLKRNSLKDIPSAYQQKYPDGSVYLALKSMIYFEDAECQDDPFSLNNTSWNQVKEAIFKVHAAYVEMLQRMHRDLASIL